MPDPFFVSSKSRKRKRSTTDEKKGGPRSRTKKEHNRPRADEEIQSDLSNEDVDDIELRPPPDEVASGDEYEGETPAEKRLRLAKLYLDSVKEELGT
jgi:ribosomal RNA-processing protein 9